jgi:hypothetical protein
MEPETTEPTSAHVEDAQRLLAEKGHDVGILRARVAAGRSGVAIGFPRDPMLHVSWPALAELAFLFAVLRARS